MILWNFNNFGEIHVHNLKVLNTLLRCDKISTLTYIKTYGRK